MIAFTTGSDVVNSDNDASDDEGHGSHVAGIIAAEKNQFWNAWCCIRCRYLCF